jgi:aspartokinase
MKKNPLNDLDQFLQQEASSIVAPTSLSDTLKQATSPQVGAAPSVSTEELLISLAQQNPTRFYDALISVGERMDISKNTMLINTALYLKHGSEWKKAVEEYWSR